MNAIRNGTDFYTTDINTIYAFWKSIKYNSEALEIARSHFPAWEEIYHNVEQEYGRLTQENSPGVCHCGSFDCNGDHGECICGVYGCSQDHG